MLDRPTSALPATVPLNKLKFGDDKPGGSINARSSNRKEGLDALAASLLAHGVIQPLIVEVWGKSDYYVVNGNRRLAALRMLVGEKRLPKDHPIKVAELDPGTDPLEASLAANIMVLPTHEVDQYEAFARLAANGQDAAEIASHFGATELSVRRRLALGKLSPTIRTAWRDGKIPVDAAQAFTLVEDHELQDKTYQSLAKGRNLYRHAVIRALTGEQDTWQTRRFLALVGKTALAAAGGRIAEDLFDTDAPKVLDPDILLRLTRERIEAECARLLADGWAWAAWERDLPAGHLGWKRGLVEGAVIGEDGSEMRATFEALSARCRALEHAGPGQSNEKWKAGDALEEFLDRPDVIARMPLMIKFKTGCRLRVAAEGGIEIDAALMRPEDRAVAEASFAAAEGGPSAAVPQAATPAPSGLSAALSQSLSEERTKAAAAALANDPIVALRAAVAALQSRQSPARLSARGFPGLGGITNTGSQTWPTRRPRFDEAFALTESASQPALLAELASLVAASLDLTDAARNDLAVLVVGQDALVDALDPAAYLAEARRAFNAEACFDRMPAKLVTAAIVEMNGHNTCASGKKADLVAHAAALARDTGWLPPQLRSAHYKAETTDEKGLA